ncbi:glycosyltransferase family 9 protein [Motiliproteus sp.]|uniref:glycosyltransferase family 9 protein n=1 Tax=Motiliproteus sp. TaxID=1898955 RepID=UPI003BA898F7
MKKLHLVNTHGIGDVVMMLPLLSWLVQHWDGQIALTLKSEVEVAVIKELLPEASFEFFTLKVCSVRELLTYVKNVRKANFDTLVSSYGVNPYKFSLLSQLLNSSTVIGWPSKLSFLNTVTNSYQLERHKVYRHMSLAPLIVPEADQLTNPPCYPPYSEILDYDKGNGIKFELTGENYEIVFAPGSGELESHKRWPAIRYAELANRLLHYNPKFNISILGSASERSLAEQIIQRIKQSHRVANFVGAKSIEDSIRFIAKSDVVVANCNGLSHIASAVQTPVVGLYGPTDVMLTGVFSDYSYPVTSSMDCSPCYGSGSLTGCGHPVCMISISVDEVYEAVLRALSS